MPSEQNEEQKKAGDMNVAIIKIENGTESPQPSEVQKKPEKKERQSYDFIKVVTKDEQIKAGGILNSDFLKIKASGMFGFIVTRRSSRTRTRYLVKSEINSCHPSHPG